MSVEINSKFKRLWGMSTFKFLKFFYGFILIVFYKNVGF